MDGHDAIAIVGIGCRFPGANNIDEFWEVLKNGEDRVIRIPRDRWNVDAFYDPDPDAPGMTYTKYAGIIEGFESWDNNFFGISDSETETMDPQQSIVLECTHMALENAGIRKTDINGSRTGVFIGCMNMDYNAQLCKTSGPEESIANSYTLTGNGNSVISARVSYIYNLLGPSMNIDTACSSSLVAIHQGCLGIKSGDCDMAICGGVNYILSPELLVTMSKSRISSLTGRCHTFSADADGYTRGEGCGIVILKRHSDAIEDGNTIWGVIATGCNQDGHMATPITAPSGEQQLRLLREVYSKHNIDKGRIQYIEAHGTGTPRGDPIEVDSLGQHFTSDSPITKYIGSVKTNIGHLESGSGVAGLIKVLLMMEHGLIAPNLHFKTPNPRIDFDAFKFKVPTSCIKWQPGSDGKRLACVNSFGFGGTNAHMVIERKEERHDLVSSKNDKHLVVFSAPSNDALIASVEDFVEKLNRGQYNLEDIAHTSIHRRDHQAFRISTVIDDPLRDNNIRQKIVQRAESCVREDTQKTRLIFVCGGVGTPWRGMCKELQQRFPVFQKALKEVSDLLDTFANINLSKQMVFFDSSDPFLSHIAIFACQIALARLWASFGITPDCIVGLSVGEVAAAAISGAISLRQAVRVIYYRSKHLKDTGEGRMFVCAGIETEDLQTVCDELKIPSPIAVYLAPSIHTLSGSEPDMSKLKKAILEKFDKTRCNIYELDTRRAYHTTHVHSAGMELQNSLEGNLIGNLPTIPVISTVSTEKVGDEFFTPDYWMRNVAEPVKFYQAIRKSAVESTRNVFIDIGPNSVLKLFLKSMVPDLTTECLPSMLNGDDMALLGSLGRIFEIGFQITYNSVYNGQKITDIPRHCPKRQSNTRFTELSQQNREHYCVYPFTHMYVQATSNPTRYKISINKKRTAFVFSHFVQENVVLPGVVHVESALAVGKTLYPSFAYHVTCNFKTFVLVDKDTLLDMDLTTDAEGYKFEIKDNKTVYADGTITPQTELQVTSFDVSELRSRCSSFVTKSDIYEILTRLGFRHGECYRLITGAFVSEREFLSEIRLNEELQQSLGDNQIHPCILDACAQTTVLLYGRPSVVVSTEEKTVPAAYHDVCVLRPITERMFVYTLVTSVTEHTASFRIYLLNDKGGVIAVIGELINRFVKFHPSDVSYNITWSERHILESSEQSRDNPLIILTLSRRVSEYYSGIILSDVNTNILLLQGEIMDEELSRRLTECAVDWQDKPIHVLYHPGTPETLGASGIHTGVVDQCYLFMRLLKTIQNLGGDVFVSVVTENAVMVDDENDKHVVEPAGFALWGTVRCLNLERPSPRPTILIDVTHDTDASYICKFSPSDLIENQWTESAIRRDRLYIHIIIKSNESERQPSFRPSLLKKDDNVVLMSEDPLEIANTFLGLESYPIKKKDDFIRVSAATVYDKIVYPPTTSALSSEEATGEALLGHAIMSLEFVGENAKGGTVVACYPSTVTSFKQIPGELQLDVDLFKNFESGMLTKMVITAGMFRAADIEGGLTVLIPDENSQQWNYITRLLKPRTASHFSVINKADIAATTTKLYRNIVCLCRIEKKDAVALMTTSKRDIHYLQNIVKTDAARSLTVALSHVRVLPHFIEEFVGLSSLKSLVSYIAKRLKKSKYSKQQTISKQLPNVSKLAICPDLLIPKSTIGFGPAHNGIPSYKSTSENVRVPREKLFLNNACYIITGGLSGLGWELVRIFAEMGAGVIVPCSRRGASKDQTRAVEGIQKEYRCCIRPMKCDVTHRGKIETLLRSIQNEFKDISIRGIFHCAAATSDVAAQSMSREQYEVAALPKVRGTWNLHEASLNLSLDYFVLCSSIAAIIGNVGQTNYAAGCCFQDAVACFRRQIGLPAQTINWGVLDLGIATASGTRDILEYQGFSFMSVSQIKDCLIDSLMRNLPQSIYCDVNWKKLFMTTDVKTRSSRPLFGFYNFRDGREVSDTNQGALGDAVVGVCDILSDVCAVDRETLEPDSELYQLGLDSLASIELVKKLENKFGVAIPIADVLTPGKTINDIAILLAVV